MEPVPEVEENQTTSVTQTQLNTRSNSITEKGQKQTSSANSKLSNFLNSNGSKPDPKMMKQKSRENNEKFKVFLNNKKGQSQLPKPPS